MLNVELLNAIVFDYESWDDKEGTIDPAIVVRGELPGTAKPFVVDRVYRAPQGYYDESFAIVSSDGEVVYQHPYARMSLRGEMYEDRFRDIVREDVSFASGDEHEIVFLVQNIEIGRIPVFVDAPDSARAQGVVGDVIGSTLKKSSIIWLTIPQPHGGKPITRPAWFIFEDDKVFVLTGPDEQDLTNIEQAEQVTIHARSADVRARVAQIPADVRVVDAESADFERIAEASVMARLNSEDGADAPERWKATCTMVELTPQT